MIRPAFSRLTPLQFLMADFEATQPVLHGFYASLQRFQASYCVDPSWKCPFWAFLWPDQLVKRKRQWLQPWLTCNKNGKQFFRLRLGQAARIQPDSVAPDCIGLWSRMPHDPGSWGLSCLNIFAYFLQFDTLTHVYDLWLLHIRTSSSVWRTDCLYFPLLDT